MHSARSLLVKQQTMLANAMRSLATEFGLTVPKGISKLGALKELVDADATCPKRALQAIGGLLDHCRALAESIETFEAEIVAHARHDETARRLATIPGVGPITASLIAATVADIGVFKSARHFAAWLGLVPRQHSTGGKTRLGRITKAGNREIRTLLVLGATSMINRAPHWNSGHCHGNWAWRARPAWGRMLGMKKPPDPHYRHRFPAELISHAVWLYHVFSLSFRDVELILAERGVIVSYETIRRWCLKFGAALRTSSADVGRGRVTSGTWTRSSFGSGVSCIISGVPSIKTGSCSISWCSVAAMRGQRNVSSSGC